MRERVREGKREGRREGGRREGRVKRTSVGIEDRDLTRLDLAERT